MRMRLVLMALVLLAALPLATTAASARAQESGTDYCEALNNPDLDDFYTVQPLSYSDGFFRPGDVIVISAERVATGPALAQGGGVPIYLEFDGAWVATGDGIIVYTVPDNPALLSPDEVMWYAVDFIFAIWDVSCIPATGQPGQPGTAPGCDALLPIPSTAVVGSFVSDALAYWEPGKLTNPLVIIEAGNTAWVLGQDASGAYYQIIWVCNYLWVPVSTMGPNYDSVWKGTPLPTIVVE